VIVIVIVIETCSSSLSFYFSLAFSFSFDSFSYSYFGSIFFASVPLSIHRAQVKNNGEVFGGKGQEGDSEDPDHQYRLAEANNDFAIDVIVDSVGLLHSIGSAAKHTCQRR
jgi:hypothetical protein